MRPRSFAPPAFVPPAFVLAALALAPAAGAAGRAAPVLPQEPAAFRATAEVVSEPVEVGEVFEVEVAVTHPPGAEAAPILDEALGAFRVLGADRAPGADEGETASAPEDSRSRFVVRLGAFVLPGDHEIPAIPVGIRTGEGELRQTGTPPTPLRVVSSLSAGAEDEVAAAARPAGVPAEVPTDIPTDIPADIHDLRGPFLHEVPPRWGVIGLWTLAALAVALAGWWLWRRRRGAAEAPVVPLAPPAAEAEAALAELARSGLLPAGEVVRFYERLAGIMKRYAGRRFGAAWVERTTGEILADLRARSLGGAEPALPLLAGVLLEADLAKFSDRPFRPAAAEARFTEAGVFLDRTRPSVTPDSPEAEPDPTDAAEPSEGADRAADAAPGPAPAPAASGESRSAGAPS